MALPAVDPDSRLLALISRAEPRFRNALLNAITATKKELTLATLTELIASGQFEAAVETAARVGAIRLGDEAAAVFTMAGQDGAKFLSDVLEVTIGFDQVNDRAVAVMQQERLRLIREFSAGQRETTRAALSDGIQRGLNPVEQARNFRDSIGLTAKQRASVARFRTLLQEGSADVFSRKLRDRRFDATIRRAKRLGKPLSSEQIERMTARYGERFVAFRAKTIARTEALRAVHLGNDENYRQAIDEGALSQQQLERTWVTARDERVRGSHVLLNGVVRGIDETFPGLDGPLRFPGDPSAPGSETIQCRCALATRIAAAP